MITNNKENQRGSFTVEATIVLFLMIMFVLYIMDVGKVYRSQNYMTHSLYQTSKYLSFASHRYSLPENNTVLAEEVLWFFGFPKEDDVEIRKKWRNKKYKEAVEAVFTNGITDADSLAKYGIENVTFDVKVIASGHRQKDMVINVTYDVQLPFRFVGYTKATLHQQIQTGLWQKEQMMDVGE